MKYHEGDLDTINIRQNIDVIMLFLDYNKHFEYRIPASVFQNHGWVTKDDKDPLEPSEVENCGIIVEVTEEEVKNSVKVMPKLDTIVSRKLIILAYKYCVCDVYYLVDKLCIVTVSR